jgi:hypothetical protein
LLDDRNMNNNRRMRSLMWMNVIQWFVLLDDRNMNNKSRMRSLMWMNVIQ